MGLYTIRVSSLTTDSEFEKATNISSLFNKSVTFMFLYGVSQYFVPDFRQHVSETAGSFWKIRLRYPVKE